MKLTSSACGIAAALLLGAASAQAATNLVTNGGFESGAYNNNAGGYDQITAGGTDLAGWTVGNSIAWGLSPTDINVHGGVGYVELTGVGTNYPNYGSISQTLSTQAGRTYNFSVFSTLLNGGGFNVFAGGSAVTLAGSYGAYSGAGGTSWGQLTGSFKATSAATVLSIQGTGSPTYVIGLDDVSVTAVGGGAVPEPASWALMITGFGLAGATLRRRRALTAA
jgi:PEP-CTERM motif